ncbi:MAG: hypothetical protein AABY18_07075 [Candidatus Thermoplasmatota archaeon]
MPEEAPDKQKARLDRLLLVAAGGTTLAILVLRLATYGNGGGGALQLIQQAMMPVPIALGAWATARNLRRSWTWLAPLALFVLCLPLVYSALERIEPDSEGSRYCGAAGFLPPMPDWEDHAVVGDAYNLGYPLLALAAMLAGGGMLVVRTTRGLGSWVLGAGIVLGVIWFAAPVCVGA